MLTGRLALAPPGAARPKPALAFAFGPRDGSPRQPAAWLAGADWIVPDEQAIEMRYLDPTRMGKLYVARRGDAAAVPGLAELGPDADDPALTLESWQARIRRHPGRAQAAPAQPGVRGRDRQCVQ